MKSYIELLNELIIPGKYGNPPYNIFYSNGLIENIPGNQFNIEVELKQINGIYRIVLLFDKIINIKGNEILINTRNSLIITKTIENIVIPLYTAYLSGINGEKITFEHNFLILIKNSNINNYRLAL